MKTSYVLLEDQLKGEYKGVFERVEIYSNMVILDEDTREDKMMNLLDLMLTVQEKGEPVEKVVGRDVEEFCKFYFGDYSWWQKLLTIPIAVHRMAWFILVVCIAELLLEWEELFSGRSLASLIQIKTDISGVVWGWIGGILVCMVLNVVLKPFIFRWKRLTFWKYFGILLATAVVVILVGMALLGDREVKVSLFGTVVVCAVYIACYLLVKLLLRYYRHHSLRRQREEYETSFSQDVWENVRCTLPEEMVKRYNKINRRREKRGREGISEEAFMEKLAREERICLRLYLVVPIVIVVFGVGAGIPEIVNHGIISGLEFLALLLVCEIPVFLLFRFQYWALRQRKILLDKECREKGITVHELYRRREGKGEKG